MLLHTTYVYTTATTNIATTTNKLMQGQLKRLSGKKLTFVMVNLPAFTFLEVFLMALEALLSVLSMSLVLTWSESGSVH